MGKTVTTTKHFDNAGNLIKEVTETVEAKSKPLHAHILIDNSSSMRGWQEKVASGVNEYINTLKHVAKEQNIPIRVSVSFFASPQYMGAWKSILREFRNPQPVDVFLPLTATEIVPNGGTPLYDAVGQTVRKLERESEGKDVALVVFTDGEENASTEYNAASIKALLKAKEAVNWQVLYLGANQDAWAVGDAMGTSKTMTAGYNMANMNQAFMAAGASTARYAATRSLEVSAFTEQERVSMIQPNVSVTAAVQVKTKTK
jgi:uncharacterized protein YegL